MSSIATGIGLRGPHYQEFLTRKPELGFVEVHAENFFGGGKTPAYLEKVRADYPVSLHGTALSLGSADGLDMHHLDRFAALVKRINPFLVSEHLSWSSVGGIYSNDLLPLPYTTESLMVFCQHVQEVQHKLKQRLLIENPSVYLRLAGQEMSETEFLQELVARTGCGLLLDVNNVFVSAHNLQFDTYAYLEEIPWHAVEEIHLAGHASVTEQGETLLIDDHGSAVRPEVWALYERALSYVDPVPTLIEWDTNVPALAVLLREASTAAAYLTRRAKVTAEPARDMVYG